MTTGSSSSIFTDGRFSAVPLSMQLKIEFGGGLEALSGGAKEFRVDVPECDGHGVRAIADTGR